MTDPPIPSQIPSHFTLLYQTIQSEIGICIKQFFELPYYILCTDICRHVIKQGQLYERRSVNGLASIQFCSYSALFLYLYFFAKHVRVKMVESSMISEETQPLLNLLISYLGRTQTVYTPFLAGVNLSFRSLSFLQGGQRYVLLLKTAQDDCGVIKEIQTNQFVFCAYSRIITCEA